MLIKHMKSGHSFPSFAAEVETSFETLYDWCNPDSPRYQKAFSEAKKIGEAALLKFDEDVGMRGTMGQLSRVAAIKTKKGADGKETVTERQYAPAHFAQAAWIFRMKNRYPQYYRDRLEHTHSDPDGKPLQPTKIVIEMPDNGRDREEDKE